MSRGQGESATTTEGDSIALLERRIEQQAEQIAALLAKSAEQAAKSEVQDAVIATLLENVAHQACRMAALEALVKGEEGQTLSNVEIGEEATQEQRTTHRIEEKKGEAKSTEQVQAELQEAIRVQNAELVSQLCRLSDDATTYEDFFLQQVKQINQIIKKKKVMTPARVCIYWSLYIACVRCDVDVLHISENALTALQDLIEKQESTQERRLLYADLLKALGLGGNYNLYRKAMTWGLQNILKGQYDSILEDEYATALYTKGLPHIAEGDQPLLAHIVNHINTRFTVVTSSVSAYTPLSASLVMLLESLPESVKPHIIRHISNNKDLFQSILVRNAKLHKTVWPMGSGDSNEDIEAWVKCYLSASDEDEDEKKSLHKYHLNIVPERKLRFKVIAFSYVIKSFREQTPERAMKLFNLFELQLLDIIKPISCFCTEVKSDDDLSLIEMAFNAVQHDSALIRGIFGPIFMNDEEEGDVSESKGSGESVASRAQTPDEEKIQGTLERVLQSLTLHDTNYNTLKFEWCRCICKKLVEPGDGFLFTEFQKETIEKPVEAILMGSIDIDPLIHIISHLDPNIQGKALKDSVLHMFIRSGDDDNYQGNCKSLMAAVLHYLCNDGDDIYQALLHGCMTYIPPAENNSYGYLNLDYTFKETKTRLDIFLFENMPIFLQDLCSNYDARCWLIDELLKTVSEVIAQRRNPPVSPVSPVPQYNRSRFNDRRDHEERLHLNAQNGLYRALFSNTMFWCEKIFTRILDWFDEFRNQDGSPYSATKKEISIKIYNMLKSLNIDFHRYSTAQINLTKFLLEIGPTRMKLGLPASPSGDAFKHFVAPLIFQWSEEPLNSEIITKEFNWLVQPYRPSGLNHSSLYPGTTLHVLGSFLHTPDGPTNKARDDLLSWLLEYALSPRSCESSTTIYYPDDQTRDRHQEVVVVIPDVSKHLICELCMGLNVYHRYIRHLSGSYHHYTSESAFIRGRPFSEWLTSALPSYPAGSRYSPGFSKLEVSTKTWSNFGSNNKTVMYLLGVPEVFRANLFSRSITDSASVRVRVGFDEVKAAMSISDDFPGQGNAEDLDEKKEGATISSLADEPASASAPAPMDFHDRVDFSDLDEELEKRMKLAKESPTTLCAPLTFTLLEGQALFFRYLHRKIEKMIQPEGKTQVSSLVNDLDVYFLDQDWCSYLCHLYNYCYPDGFGGFQNSQSVLNVMDQFHGFLKKRNSTETPARLSHEIRQSAAELRNNIKPILNNWLGITDPGRFISLQFILQQLSLAAFDCNVSELVESQLRALDPSAPPKPQDEERGEAAATAGAYGVPPPSYNPGAKPGQGPEGLLGEEKKEGEAPPVPVASASPVSAASSFSSDASSSPVVAASGSPVLAASASGPVASTSLLAAAATATTADTAAQTATAIPEAYAASDLASRDSPAPSAPPLATAVLAPSVFTETSAVSSRGGAPPEEYITL